MRNGNRNFTNHIVMAKKKEAGELNKTERNLKK